MNKRHYSIYKYIIENILLTQNSFINQAELKKHLRDKFGYGRETPERMLKIFNNEGLLVKFIDKKLGKNVLIKRGIHKENNSKE